MSSESNKSKNSSSLWSFFTQYDGRSYLILSSVVVGSFIAYNQYRLYRLKKKYLRELYFANKKIDNLEAALDSYTLDATLLRSKSSDVFNEHLLKSVEGLEEPKKEIRIWMDGVFDMMHYGHMNAFRKGRALGTHLVVGVNGDASVTECKGKPVNNDEERLAVVEACRWVDEVVPNVPYVMTAQYLEHIIEKYRIDFVVHGDDPCIVNGEDVYGTAKKMGKYLSIPRTEGVSTTDIVGRMLLMTTTHHQNHPHENKVSTVSNKIKEHDQEAAAHGILSHSTVIQQKDLDHGHDDHHDDENEDVGLSLETESIDEEEVDRLKAENDKKSILRKKFHRKSHFLTSSRVIRLFSAGIQAPSETDTIVYLAGAWDMFHARHVDILKKAREFGSYVIVGVHSDAVVNAQLGLNYPILNLHERILSVMGCKYVDDVIFDAPFEITQEFVQSLNISVVVSGKDQYNDGQVRSDIDIDPYHCVREMGILKVVETSLNISVTDIVERIQNERDRYAKKFEKKTAQEDDYYHSKAA